jgi:hypothetical protein
MDGQSIGSLRVGSDESLIDVAHNKNLADRRANKATAAYLAFCMSLFAKKNVKAKQPTLAGLASFTSVICTANTDVPWELYSLIVSSAKNGGALCTWDEGIDVSGYLLHFASAQAKQACIFRNTGSPNIYQLTASIVSFRMCAAAITVFLLQLLLVAYCLVGLTMEFSWQNLPLALVVALNMVFPMRKAILVHAESSDGNFWNAASERTSERARGALPILRLLRLMDLTMN